MKPDYLRVILYVLSGLLAFIPAAWANYGVSFSDGILYANISVMAELAVTALAAAFGLGGIIFGFWGSGGRGAIRRTVVYVLSPFAAMLAAGGAGWGISIVDATVAIHIETFVGAVFAGSGLSLSILRRWGVR